MKKNLAIFVKINTFGVIAVIGVIIFVCAFGIYGFTNTSYYFSWTSNDASIVPVDSSNIVMFETGFSHIMGILGGGYYLHNISLPILRNNKKKENNNRDLFIGYCMVFLSYALCSTLGYFGFTGSYF